MSNEKQYLSVNKEHLSRVYQNVGSLSDKLDMDVFQNFVDVQNNDDPEFKKQVFNQVLLEIKKTVLQNRNLLTFTIYLDIK